MQIISDHPLPRYYRIVDPRNGAVLATGQVPGAHQLLPDTGTGPRVTILTNETASIQTGAISAHSRDERSDRQCRTDSRAGRR